MIKNLYEAVIAAEYDQLRPSIDGFCECDVCREDVQAYVLNRLRPRYVVGRSGQFHSRVEMQRAQELARVEVFMLEAFRRVQEAPKEDCLSRTS